MYTSGTWGYVYAVDAATGKELWRYDPKGDWFPATKSVLRSRQPRRRRVEGQGLCRLGRRPAACARRGDRQASLGGRHHRRPQAALLEHGRAADRRETWWSSATAARTWGTAACAAMSRPTTCDAASSNGGSTPCRRRPAGRSRTRISPRPRRPGTRIAIPKYKGGGTAWDGFAYDPALKLVYFGTAMRRPMTCGSSAMPSSTGSIPPRSSPCMPTPGVWPGTTRRHRTITGTSTPPRN